MTTHSFPTSQHMNETQLGYAGGTNFDHGQIPNATQATCAVVTQPPTSHTHHDTHSPFAGGTNFDHGQDRCDTQPKFAVVTQPPTSQYHRDTQMGAAGGTNFDHGQYRRESHPATAVVIQPPTSQTRYEPQGDSAGGTPLEPWLFDPVLSVAAEALNDIETTRTGCANRLRTLTKTEPDKDGVMRGFGLSADDPGVIHQTALYELLGKVEHQAELTLGRAMRKHPLYPWLLEQKGLGVKQGARLLGAIGDPYVNMNTGQPRGVYQLYAYCGLANDSEGLSIQRRKGVKFNWSADARSRAWLVAESCSRQRKPECRDSGLGHIPNCQCSPYRLVYELRREATEDRTHKRPCVRCGPAGKPAPVGSPWSDKHKHMDAYRIVSKKLLKNLWQESQRLHLGAL